MAAEQVALVAFMTGALYSLAHAMEYGIDDARMKPNLGRLAAECNQVLDAIVQSKEPQADWLSGFYIDSAMLRLDALADRLKKQLHLAKKPLTEPHVPNAVNSMKHDRDAGIAQGWEVRFASVMKAAEELCPPLERAVP
jgi:hypothetical protein